MATITITLPDAAVAHAQDCAKAVGQDSLESWITEWLINTVKQVELTRKQKDVQKLQKQVETQIDTLYTDGTVGPLLVTTPKVVA